MALGLSSLWVSRSMIHVMVFMLVGYCPHIYWLLFPLFLEASLLINGDLLDLVFISQQSIGSLTVYRYNI
jgi:hypothetical protein